VNSVHDMGGMAGLGRLDPEPDEPVFHADWERRVHALVIASPTRGNIDAGRHQRELIPGRDYLRMSYYEKWLAGLCEMLVKGGAITAAELHRALGLYCSNEAYLGNTRKGAWRLDLDGNPAGTVTADEEAHAKATLAGIRAKKEARTAAAKAAAQPAILQPAKRLSLADLKAAALARKDSPKEEQRA